ncbi:MAG: 4Fe-4S dicluster domain-containing protein [Planctomycetes bacterium]|nr:4Fe-4S dicluster domain-containing protein [Planctomycetota bacterium]
MARIAWEPEAEQALSRAPFFVRPLARRKVEERVRARGGERVTLADVREGEARFKAAAGEKSQAELQRMMPQANQPGAEMLAIEVCHCELSGCPNVLIKPGEWKQAIEDWARASDISERLRRRVEGDRILFHHKLRIAIAGCPNGCSRPQIADIGLVGLVRPGVDPDKCIACRACEEACPDKAITIPSVIPSGGRLAAEVEESLCQGCTRCRDICPPEAIALSEPAGRILAGGKLGRHPHLAEAVGTAASPAEAVRTIAEAVERFLAEALPGERFAEHWMRVAGQKDCGWGVPAPRGTEPPPTTPARREAQDE